MATEARIDPAECIGSTECNRIAPSAFALDDETGVSVVLPGAAATDEAALLEAAESCPTRAISLRRADGTTLLGDG